MKLQFQEYKERLFEILLSENNLDELTNFIDQLNNQGYTQKEIYNLFLDFHSEIQIDPRTKESEKAYNSLSDFMDRFTDWV